MKVIVSAVVYDPAKDELFQAEKGQGAFMNQTRLRVAGVDDFVVKTRNRADQVRLEPGSHVQIGWLPEDCRALDA